MKNLDEIRLNLNDYKARGLKVFATSSFQSHSIPMLHIISKIDNTIPIYYLNTGYLFPETIAFKDELAALLKLNFYSLSSSVSKSQQKDGNGQLLFASDPDYCCFLNKSIALNINWFFIKKAECIDH